MLKTKIKKNLILGMTAAMMAFIPCTVLCQELLEEEELPLESLEDKSFDFSFKPNMDIQRTIVIADNVWNYDLNPQTSSYASEAQVLTGLYEGLFTYNPYSCDPDYALCVSSKTSRDKKRWTFTMRDNAYFSNGEKITAQTIKNSWISLLANPNAPYASTLDCVQGAKEFREGKTSAESVRIVVKDEKTLVVYLVEPTEHLPYLLCHHSLVAISSKANVYSGAFVLKSYRGGILRMEKNDKYWDAENVYIPGITIIQSSNDEDIVYRYNNGKIDWISSSIQSDRLIDKSDTRVNAEFGTMYYFFKMRNNVWQYPEFRKALLEAFPYEEIRSKYYFPAETFVFPLSGYPNVIGYNETNLDDAQELLNEAKKKYGIKQDEKLILVVAVSSDDAYQKSFAELMRTQFANLNIEVIIQEKPFATYNSEIPNWEADIFTYGWVGDYADPLAFLELFKSSSTLNVGNYKNEKYDSLLSQANVANSNADHYKLLAEAEQLLLDDGEVIPINYFITSNTINLKTIGGWYQNSLDIHPLKYLYLMESEYTNDGFVFNLSELPKDQLL